MYCMFPASTKHLSELNRWIRDSEQVYVPSEPGRCRHCCWCRLSETTPSRTVCWAGPGWRRCWTSAPRTSSGGCCTPGWNARLWPELPPAAPSADPPEVSSRSSLWRKRVKGEQASSWSSRKASWWTQRSIQQLKGEQSQYSTSIPHDKIWKQITLKFFR